MQVPEVMLHEVVLRHLSGLTARSCLAVLRVFTKSEPDPADIRDLDALPTIIFNEARMARQLLNKATLEPEYRVEIEQSLEDDIVAAAKEMRLVLRQLEEDWQQRSARRLALLNAESGENNLHFKQFDKDFYAARIQRAIEQLEQAKSALDVSVQDARDGGMTWTDIGKVAGISHQSAMNRWSERARAAKRQRARLYRAELREKLDGS